MVKSNIYSYYMPTKILFETNGLKKIGELLGKEDLKSALIVTDKGIVNAGLLEDLKDSLNKSNITYHIFDSVEPNPRASTIRRGLEFQKDHDNDVVIGIGGGSSIDTAKAIAAMATNAGDILDYEGVGKIVNNPLPIVAVPTTAGTGSEVTASTVITDEKTLFKAAIVSEKLFPKLAILDASLTLKCPPHITSSTGMDALTHALESYVSKQGNPISKSIALHAITLITENLSRAYFYGSDIESRARMLEASMLAGLAFSQTRLGNVHAISQSFGGVFDVPHGIANATLLPFILKFNLPACIEEMVEVAKAMKIDVNIGDKLQIAEKVIEKVIEWNELYDIPDNTRALGVKLEEIEKLINDSMRSGNILVNPRLTTAKDVEQIIRESYAGYSKQPEGV